MNLLFCFIWPQPLAPVHSVAISSLVAIVPLLIVLLLMGVLRKSGLFSSGCGLASAAALAIWVWHMPAPLAGWSVVYGFAFAVWSILWLVFNGLWLYNLSVATGAFEVLRQWMEQYAQGDACVQAILVAFCFGALLEGSAGFGAPVAVTAFLLVGLGFEARKAVVISLLSNTAPVAFGALGAPLVALAGVTGIDISKLSSMVGRQLPFLSFVLPLYLAWVVAGRKGLRQSWPAACVAGTSFASVQFLVSNLWGPYATDVLSSLVSMIAVVTFLWLRSVGRKAQATKTSAAPAVSTPQDSRPPRLMPSAVLVAWLPWASLSIMMIVWTYLNLFQTGQITIAVPHLHNAIFITLYQRSYSALFSFQPLSNGTAVLATVLFTALCFRASPRVLWLSAKTTIRQLRLPGLTVLCIVGLAYLYNYSGMAYTVGAAVAALGSIFPLVSSYLGWVACFLSGSDTASNVLFGNLQVAAAHPLHLNPVLLAATNSSGAVTGKMISLQNIAVGVTTVKLVGEEGKILRNTFWHSVLFAGLIGVLALIQTYILPGMVP